MPADEPTDEELVLRAQSELPYGTASYRLLVERHSSAVFGRSFRILRSRSDAEDAVQEVFLNVFRALPAYRPERPFRHWLSVITLNACRLSLRRRAQEQRRREGLAREPDAPALLRPSDPILREHLAELLDDLPPETRIAILMRVLEERPYKEIAEHLEMGESAVKMRIARGCEALRKRFEERRSDTPEEAPRFAAGESHE